MKSKFDTSLYLPQFMNMESMSSTQGAHGFSSSWKTFWVYRYSSSALQHPSIARWLPSTDTTANGKKISYRSTLSIRFKGHLETQQHSNTATQQTKQGIEKLSSNTTAENLRTDLFFFFSKTKSFKDLFFIFTLLNMVRSWSTIHYSLITNDSSCLSTYSKTRI